MEPNRPTAEPEAPILVVGRTRPFLDVRWLVDDAEGHLAEDFRGHVLHPVEIACYDRYGRPLDLTLRADDTVRLSVSQAAADPVALRGRLTAVCAEARKAHATVDEENRCDLRELDLPDDDFPELAVAMAKRFGHSREHAVAAHGHGHGPDGNGAGATGPRTGHSGSRLHNFWHAIT